MVVPATTKGDVIRSRLLARLTTALDEPWTLTLVDAPAGAGKTRLLAQWARTMAAAPDTEVVWVSLHRGEADLELVRTALERIDEARLQEAIGRVPAEASVTTARALGRALGVSSRRLVIVVDDVHRVETPALAEMLSVFVQAVPGNVHVVLSGRGTRMIPLARRRIAGVGLELGARDLAFGPDEVRRFFQARGVRLSQGEVSTVLRRTEGWATALQLMAMGSVGLRGTENPLRGDAPPVVDYFLEEVFVDLDDELTGFLEVTAIPETFSLDLADVLTGGVHAGATVDRLLRLNVLRATAGEEPPRYHYHPLLREFLLARLRERGHAEVERLEGLAAARFAGQQEHRSALAHATRSADRPGAGTVLRRSGMHLVLSGRADDVVAALARMPLPHRAEPTARMLIAAAELARGDASAAIAALPARSETADSEVTRRWQAGLDLHTAVHRGGIAETVRRLTPELASAVGEVEIDIHTFLHAAMAELYVGRLDRAEGFARLAEDLARTAGTGAAELQAGAVRNTAALFRGRMREVIESGAALDRRWQELGAPDDPFYEVTRVWRAWVSYEGMEAYADGAALRRAATVLAAGAEPAIARGLRGLIALRAAEDADDPHAAAAALIDALSPRDDLPLPVHWYAMMGLFAVRALIRLDEHALRDRFVSDAAAALGESGELHVLRALCALHDHRTGIAREEVAAALDGSAPWLLPASMVDAWLVEADLDVQDGEPDRGQLALATALALAEPEGHVRRVAEAGPVVARLLSAKATPGSRTRFAESVRERLAAAGVLVDEELTHRERIVLAALSRNATLRQIAQQEFISPNTVKTHVRNIYRKLGVSDRDSVTAAAHALGIG